MVAIVATFMAQFAGAGRPRPPSEEYTPAQAAHLKRVRCTTTSVAAVPNESVLMWVGFTRKFVDFVRHIKHCFDFSINHQHGNLELFHSN